jgi:hypothetical protein
MSHTTVLELVFFQAAAGCTHEQMLAAIDASQTWLARQPGYISRRVSHDGAQWVDAVVWASLDQALRAAEGFNQSPEAQAFGALIDPSSVRMHHLQVVRDTLAA